MKNRQALKKEKCIKNTLIVVQIKIIQWQSNFICFVEQISISRKCVETNSITNV